jgi:hypothetical protein
VGIVVFLTVAAITVAMSPREADRQQRVAEPQERIQVDLFEGRFRGN